MQKGPKLPTRMKSSGNKASLKCIIFINKKQENEFATTLKTQFLFESKKKRFLSIINRKKTHLLTLLQNNLKKKLKNQNSPHQPSLNYSISSEGEGTKPFYNTSPLTNIIPISCLLKGFDFGREENLVLVTPLPHRYSTCTLSISEKCQIPLLQSDLVQI